MQRCILAILSLAFCAGMQTVSEDVQFNLVTPRDVRQSIGSVGITEADRGLEFAPELWALPPDKRDFHIHAEGSCQSAMKESKAVAAGAADGHYDPRHTGKHEGPLGAGHLDDLPLLAVNSAGVADQPIITPHLKTLDEARGKAPMVHMGGDSVANNPRPLSDGGEQFACGAIKQFFRQSRR